MHCPIFFQFAQGIGGSRPSDKEGGAGHPEPEIRAGPRLKKNIFSALRASFWSKNKVGGGGEPGPRAPPLDPPLQGFFTHIKTESTRKLSNLNFH